MDSMLYTPEENAFNYSCKTSQQYIPPLERPFHNWVTSREGATEVVQGSWLNTLCAEALLESGLCLYQLSFVAL